MAFLVDQVLEQQQKQFIDIVPGILQVSASSDNRDLKGRHTPDAIQQRGAIFHFSKADKSVYNRKVW